MANTLSFDIPESTISQLRQTMVNAAQEAFNGEYRRRVFPEFMMKKDLCAYLSVSNNTADKLIKTGLPYVEVSGVIRYPKKAIDKFMTENIK